MKHTLLSGLALAALAVGPAMAADMPVKAPPPVMAALAYDWSGFYFGLNGGVYRSHTSWFFPGPNTSVNVDATGNQDFAFGAQLGARAQWSYLVVGAEVSGDEFTGSGSSICPSPNTAFVCGITPNHVSMVTGQLGFAWDRVLIFGKGGWASINMTTTALPVFVGFNDSKNFSAGVAGGGIEIGIDPHMGIGVEYLHVFNNAQTFAPVPVIGGVTRNVSADLDIVRAYFNVRVNPWAHH
jgi:outer membrane immunogenic protein